MDFNENITKVVVALLGFLGGGAGVKLIDKWSEWRTKKEKKSILWNLSNLAEVHHYMAEVVTRTPVTRMLIVRGSNGGSTPKPGSEFYITVVHEEHKDKEHNKDVHNRYRGIKIDGTYVTLLLEMIAKGAVKYKISDMPEGVLKGVYTADQVKYSEIHFLKSTDTELYYAAVSTTNDNETFSGVEARIEIDLAIDKIKQIFNKY